MRKPPSFVCHTSDGPGGQHDQSGMHPHTLPTSYQLHVLEIR